MRRPPHGWPITRGPIPGFRVQKSDSTQAARLWWSTVRAATQSWASFLAGPGLADGRPVPQTRGCPMNAKVIVAGTHAKDEGAAVAALMAQLSAQAPGLAIQGAIFFASPLYQAAELQTALAARLPRVPFLGLTSCLGTASSAAAFGNPRSLSGLFLMGDGFRVGVSSAGWNNRGRRGLTASPSRWARSLSDGGRVTALERRGRRCRSSGRRWWSSGPTGPASADRHSTHRRSLLRAR